MATNKKQESKIIMPVKADKTEEILKELQDIKKYLEFLAKLEATRAGIEV